MKRNRQRASSLGVVVVTLALLVLMVFLAISSGLRHLEIANHMVLRSRARDAAESILHLSIAKVCKNGSFGQNYAAGACLRVAAPDLADECRAVVSFDQGVASSERIPYSTNNLASDSSVAGDGRSVPAHAVHLVALGCCRSEKIQIETVFINPPFPSGCASRGPVKLKAVNLWGFPPDRVPAAPLLPDPNVPAHVYTNSVLPDALDLGPGCDIYGDAAAVGGIKLDPGANVRGEMRPGSQPNQVPHFDIAAMYGSIAQYVGQVPYQPGKPVQTFCVLGSDLTVAGDLELEGGVLAVRGNLTVAGQVKGQGLILATGNVSARTGAAFVGQRKLALLAGGNLDLSGQNSATYTFNGLLYAHGSIQAHDLTVLGSLISDGPTGSEIVKLERVAVVQTNVSVTGAVAMAKPHNHTSGQLVVGLQSQVDPANLTKRMISGSILQNKQKTTTGVFPSPNKEGFRIVFAPPTATFITMGPTGAIVSSTQQPYGSETMPYTAGDPEGSSAVRIARARQTRAGQMAEQFLAPRKDKDLTEDVLDKLGQQFCYLVQAQGPDQFSLELNNLIPGVERVRLLTWVESAPSR
ncbi:hypothetical protein IV102_00890 [bacterium]|nr:hypothetical protein [bacterium]